MPENRSTKPRKQTRVGYVAFYKGEQIASAVDLKQLANRKKVKVLLGDEALVIKHSVPGNLIAIY